MLRLGRSLLCTAALWFAAGAGATGGLSASARGEPIRQVELGPGSPVGRGTADVYVNDSFESADALDQAEVFAARGQWSEAAALLQRTSDGAGEKVVRISEGYYVGIRARINRTIANWPVAGLEAYRALFEQDLADALAWSGRRGRLGERLDLFDRYFCTASAIELADSIAQRAIESGDVVLAEHVYRRVLNEHPDRATHAVRLGAMLVLLSEMRGGRAPDAPLPGAEITILWRGEDRRLAEVLPEIRADFSGFHAQTSPSDWPIFGGNPERSRPMSTDVDEAGLLWRFDFVESSGHGLPSARAEARGSGERARGRHLTLQPVANGPFIYVQFLRQVVALHRRTGAVAWRFRESPGASTGLSFLDDQAPRWDAVTLDDGRVYASLPGDPVPYYSYESARSPAELICLDAATGQVIWRLDQQVIEERFAEITFDSSPVIADGRLFVIGRRRRSFGFEDCYLYCFDAATGRMRYRTHLGSGSTGTFGSREATESFATLHGDTVYVCSHLGTIAAVSAPTGAIRWLRLYERGLRGGGADGAGRSTRSTQPWHLNPVWFSGGQLVVLPQDGANVLLLSADDGGVLHSIPTARLSGMTTVLGLRGRILCGTGDDVVCYDVEAGKTLWTASLPEGSGVYGRGVWVDGGGAAGGDKAAGDDRFAGDRLLVPTRRWLTSFRVADGERTDTAWDLGGEGGNLLALPGQILVAGARRVSAFAAKKEIWKALRDRMAAAPNDPLPALELAEVALSNGEFIEAVAALDEAVRRAGGLAEPLEESLGRRVFDDVLMFVNRLSARSMLDVELLDKLFRYASQCPPDATAERLADAHLTYRFRFAELFEEFEQYDRAMRLYHQVLRDRSLRALPIDPTAIQSETAGATAQRCIADLITKYGRGLYAPYEQEAGEWVARAQKAGDEATLHRVVATFPNSRAAPRALVAHGTLLAGRGLPEEAARRFAKAYHRYPKQVAAPQSGLAAPLGGRPGLLRKIADAYEAAGKAAYAYRWLTKAAREHPSVRIETPNGPMTFLEYRSRLNAVRKQVEPSRPTIVLPLNERFVRVFDEGATLLVPRFGEEPASSWSRYFVHTSQGIRAFDTRSGKEIWSAPARVRRKAEWLHATDEIAVFANAYEVFALDIQTGARRWSLGEYPRNLDAPDADWEDSSSLRLHALRGNHLISARDDGEVSCVAIDTGKVLWSRTLTPGPSGTLRLSDRFVVYTTVQEGREMVCLVDAAHGNWFDTIATREKRAVVDLFVTLDGQIIVVTSEAISAYDPETRRRRWRVTFRGRLRRASLRLDVDAVYASDDGRHLEKFSVEDGERLWRSERLVPRGDDDLSVVLQDGSVIVTSSSSVSAVDTVTGLTLWRATTPDRPRFVARGLTDSYVVAVDVPREDREAPTGAYFWDHRNASGIIARHGGAPKLGVLADVSAVLIADGALLIQHGSTITGFTHKD